MRIELTKCTCGQKGLLNHHSFDCQVAHAELDSLNIPTDVRRAIEDEAELRYPSTQTPYDVKGERQLANYFRRMGFIQGVVWGMKIARAMK